MAHRHLPSRDFHRLDRQPCGLRAKERRERKETVSPLRAALLGLDFMVLSLLVFGRFFTQRVCGLFFARRGGDEFHAARGSFALALADVIEEPIQVVTRFAREIVARLADFSQDFVWFHARV